MNDRAGAVQRPELEPQVAVVGDAHAVVARDPDRMEDGVAGGRTDCLADAGDVQNARLGDVSGLERPRRHTARCRAGAKVGETMLTGVVVDEIDRGRRLRIPAHLAGVDAFGFPECHEAVAEGIATQAGEISDGRALAGGGNRAVGGVAAMAGEISPVGLAVEFQHRFAEAHDFWLQGASSSGRWP
jgi:hypothetical protein